MKSFLIYYCIPIIANLLIVASQVEPIPESVNNPLVLPKTVTYPGTKWCGPGNNAANYDDLGEFSETDKCCRAHDHCPELIKAFQTNYTLHNWTPITILSCKCDEELRTCLRTVNTSTSNTVGEIYFDGQKECIVNDYPQERCMQYMYGISGRRCTEYELDEESPKEWQFRDNAYFHPMEQ